MAMFKMLGLIGAAALLALAAFLAHTPWRVHGGRFITEYLLLGGVVAIVGLVILAATLRWA
jgi:hypothetical protein